MEKHFVVTAEEMKGWGHGLMCAGESEEEVRQRVMADNPGVKITSIRECEFVNPDVVRITDPE